MNRVENLPAVEQELRDKIAFVLGGSSGLGLASAKLLAERGAGVVIFGHAPDALTIAADLASTGLKIHGMQGDAAQSKIVNSAIEETVSKFGGLDILVNSAAIHPVGDVITTDEATWDRTMAVTQLNGRMIQPEEVAAVALYLASNESAMVTGSALIIDGGWSAGK